MRQRNITQEEIENQYLYRTKHWSILLPERPVSSSHFMIVSSRDGAKQFVDLLDEELVEMRLLVELLIKLIEDSGSTLKGYNLFSNNGTYEIGQHLNRFHQHIFVRTDDEVESPYVAMAHKKHWAEVGSSEWISRRNKLRSLLNS